MTESEKSAAAHLDHLLRGYFVAQSLFVAARLSIADHLANGPRTAAELATATGVNGDTLYRMLRALASENIFEETDAPAGPQFSLTPSSHLLRADVEGSMRPAALIAGETQYKVWAVFKDAIKYGPTKEATAAAPPAAFERIFRKPLFEFLAEHPDIYALFNAAMSHRSLAAREALLHVCHLEPGHTVIDIGGGLGSIAMALLEKFPHAQGIVFDTPRVIDQARQAMENHPLHTRLSWIAGDFLRDTAAIPAGDVMILASVLHMLEDPPAIHLLKNFRASLAARGRLYIAEHLLRGPNEKDPAKWHDLNMLLMTGGRERTFEQYAHLLHAAGFARTQRRGEIILTYRE